MSGRVAPEMTAALAVEPQGNEPPEALRRNSEPAQKNVFQEFNKHLLIVSEAAAALADRKTYLVDVTPPRIGENCNSLSERTVGLA